MKTNSKLQTPAKQSPVSVPVRFAKGDYRIVHFKQTRKHVAVTCRGLPRLTIREYANSHRASDRYEAFITTPKGSEQFVTGRSEELCYKRAVAEFWTTT